MIVHVGDRVLLHSFALYRGETLPDIPESEYTAVILLCEGDYQYFYKIQRDHDGRSYPIMHKDIKSIVERKSDMKKQPRRGRNGDTKETEESTDALALWDIETS